MIVTRMDAAVLETVIRRRLLYSCRGRKALLAFHSRLRQATWVDDIPGTAVTMNSVLLLRELRSAAAFSIALVFPWEASPADARVSVLSPLGLELLGRAVGDVVFCRGTGQPYQFRIDEVVFQPEAATAEARRR